MMNKKVVILILIIGFLLAGILYLSKKEEESLQKNDSPPTELKNEPSLETLSNVPISDAESRVNKKPFGLFVTPTNSPISPERFRGFHTGTDFEVTGDELNTVIPIRAICDGEVLGRQIISGYGGVILQSCLLEGQKVTVLYGHLDLNTKTVSNSVKKGDFLANLAPANSAMSGGERKHLHLGIIKGEKVDLRGYVQNKNELSGWLDPKKYF